MPHKSRDLGNAGRLQRLAAKIRVCTKCPLHASRTCAVPGEGPVSAPVLVIGEAPGREEDAVGRPFVGAAGRFLSQVLAGTGLERSDLFITNTVKCRPPDNRTPKKLEIDTCTSLYLSRQVELINPRVVLLLGTVAAKKVLGVKCLETARGRLIERNGRKYLVTYHPAARRYWADLDKQLRQDFLLLKRVVQG